MLVLLAALYAKLFEKLKATVSLLPVRAVSLLGQEFKILRILRSDK
jgi:hypothetical protein